jgi:hypothetical protein
MTDKLTKKVLEWIGVLTAIAYSMLVASNTGNEVLGFALLLISAVVIGAWAFLCRHFWCVEMDVVEIVSAVRSLRHPKRIF